MPQNDLGVQKRFIKIFDWFLSLGKLKIKYIEEGIFVSSSFMLHREHLFVIIGGTKPSIWIGN